VKEKFGLTVPQVNLAADVLAVVFPDRLGCHPDRLHAAAGALRAAAMVCEIAAALHEKDGREVLLKTACQKLYLPTAKQDAVGAGGTQELIAKMFGPVHVDMVDPIANRRDAWESKLVASCEVDVIAKKACAALNRLNSLDPTRSTDNPKQPEDLTALGEEPKRR
jgi:hypothetical protein